MTDFYATNLIGQLVNKSVIDFMDIHKCVSMSMSMSMSMSAAGIEDIEYVKKIDSNILCNEVSF